MNKRKMRLGIKLAGVGTLDTRKPGNVQGDELVAVCWQKYLLRRDDVESVDLYGPDEPMRSDLDVLVHFYPTFELHPSAKNVYYLQNAFPPETYSGGTVGVYNQVKDRFTGIIFTSEKLMHACGPGAVVPFAADPEELQHLPDVRYRHNISFVGNDIRGATVNNRYFVPAIPFGLVIYGNNVWQPPLNEVCRGKLPMPDLPKLYSSCLINLNAHVQVHIDFDTINLRVFEALACEGFLISDHHPSMEAEFGDAVVCTTGDEDLWAKLVRYLADEPERERRRKLGRDILLSRHSYKHRADSVMEFLNQIA